MTDMIVCSRCGQDAPRYQQGSRACGECSRLAARLRAAARDPQKHRESVRAWKRRNPVAVAQQRKLTADKAGREYVPRLDKDVRLRAARVRRAEAQRARANRFQTAGMSAVEKYRWQMKNRPDFVINQRMRTSIKKALRGRKAGRRWEMLVGYTCADLIEHLMKQMPAGYTLEDLGSGRIHIDHIVPKSSFDVTDPAELRACWSLANLRPVPAVVNLRKGAKRESLL